MADPATTDPNEPAQTPASPAPQTPPAAQPQQQPATGNATPSAAAVDRAGQNLEEAGRGSLSFLQSLEGMGGMGMLGMLVAILAAVFSGKTGELGKLFGREEVGQDAPQNLQDSQDLQAAAGDEAVIVKGDFPVDADIEHKGEHINLKDLDGKDIAIAKADDGSYTLAVRAEDGEIKVYEDFDIRDLGREMQQPISEAFEQQQAQLAQNNPAPAPAATATLGQS